MHERFSIPVLLAVVLGGFGIWYFSTGSSPTPLTPVDIGSTTPSALTLPADEANSPLLKTTPGVERRYVNDALKFYFRLPDGYMATDQPTTLKTTHAVIVVNKAGDGFLVIAVPLKADSGPLSADAIQANSPEQTITNVQEVPVNGGITGYMFQTDNPLWKGNGVGLWFTHDGYLYKVSSYARDLPLVDFARVSWGFE
jgi:hypothetical protein